MPRNPPTTDLRPWFVAVDELLESQGGRPLDWGEWFGNPNPVELDIGSGRGKFLVAASETAPERNYVGLEIDFTEGRRSARRLVKREAANARVVGGDARLFLTKLVPKNSVDVAHVLFPDPWWKRRHRRRRLFNDEFLESLTTVIRPGGTLHSATDVGDYWEVISALVDHHPRFERLPNDVPDSSGHAFLTSFEKKKREAGETIDRGFWRFVG